MLQTSVESVFFHHWSGELATSASYKTPLLSLFYRCRNGLRTQLVVTDVGWGLFDIVSPQWDLRSCFFNLFFWKFHSTIALFPGLMLKPLTIVFYTVLNSHGLRMCCVCSRYAELACSASASCFLPIMLSSYAWDVTCVVCLFVWDVTCVVCFNAPRTACWTKANK